MAFVLLRGLFRLGAVGGVEFVAFGGLTLLIAMAALACGWVYLNSFLAGVFGLPGLGLVIPMFYAAAAVLTAPGASLRVRVSVIIVLFAVLAILAIGPPAQEQGVS